MISNSINNYGLNKYVVTNTSGDGTYTTVQSALDAAALNATSSNLQTVYINGIFTEDINIPDYVNLSGFTEEMGAPTAVIQGNATRSSITVNSFSSILGITLQSSNASPALSIGGVAALRIENSNLINSSTGNAVAYSSTSNSNFQGCSLQSQATSITLNITSTGGINAFNCSITNNGTGTAVSSSSTGGPSLQQCNISAPTGKVFDLSGGGAFAFYCSGGGGIKSTINSSQFISLFCNLATSYDVSGSTFFVSFMSVCNAAGTFSFLTLHAGTTAIMAYCPITSVAPSGFAIEAGGAGDAGTFIYSANTFSPFGTANSYDPLLTLNGLSLSCGEIQTAVTTFTSATAGGASALPATPTGYLPMIINGVSQKIPFYDT